MHAHLKIGSGSLAPFISRWDVATTHHYIRHLLAQSFLRPKYRLTFGKIPMFSRKQADQAPDTDSDSTHIKEAVGLSYDEANRRTPVVSSKGEGAMADAIIAMANELGIYVHQDEQLLNELKCLKEGEEIPRELFEVIAQILAFSYLLQGKTPQAWTRPDGSRAININA